MQVVLYLVQLHSAPITSSTDTYKLYSIFKSLKTLNFINHKYLSLYEPVQTVIIISQMGRQRGSDTYLRINASLLKEDFKGHSLLTIWRKPNYYCSSLSRTSSVNIIGQQARSALTYM